MEFGMKIAITVWNERIAPVFDVAGNCIIGETQGFGHPVSQMQSITLPLESAHDKAALLASIGVKVLVCGAVSRECEYHVLAQGIEMFGFIAGELTDVLDAWADGSLEAQRFSMPGGVCPRHRRRQARHGCPGGYRNRW
jgi:predicted Fe-Mo cluster-binding NifX family protein